MDNNLELTNDANIPQSTKLIEFTFALFGVGSLLAWNAILNELTFFNTFIGKLKPFQTIAFLNFAPNIILQFLLLWKKNLFKIKNQLIIALVASIALLILIPATIIIFQDHEIVNMIIIVFLILVMGLVNALCTSGFFSFTSYFPLEMIIALSTGQGIAGIFLNVIMYIIIPSVKIDDIKKKEIITAIIFFGISALVLLICLFCLLISLKKEYFKYYLNAQSKEINEVGKITDNKEDNALNEELNEMEDYNIKIGEKVTFLDMFKILRDIDLLCVFTYIVTIGLYPTAFEQQKIFEIGDYNFNTILTIYNFFDTLGRILVSKIKPTKKLTYICVLGRGVLIITILLNCYFGLKNYNIIFTSIFLILNDTILALTNGIGTTLCFGIAPTLVNDDLKGQAGASVSFFTIVGIFSGSVFAFLIKFILKQF